MRELDAQHMDGDVQIKMQDGANTWTGSITSTVLELKKQIGQVMNISEQRQRLFFQNAQGSDS